MRIHAVKAGFGGNANVEYVELRMNSAGQAFIAAHTIQFFDGSNTLKATFTFPANVTNSSLGDSILIATSEFNVVAGGGAADFTFSNTNTVASNGGDALHPLQSPNGKVLYAPGSSQSLPCNAGGPPVDSVAYGTATANFGTASGALPGASDSRALRLSNLNSPPSNNSTEYSLQQVSTTSFSVAAGNLPTDFTTPRNNGRMVLSMTAPAAVGGVAEVPGGPIASTASSEGARSPSITLLWLGAAAFATLTASAAGALFVGRLRH
jgi:hypothetical protein